MESSTLKCINIIKQRLKNNQSILNGGLGENPFPAPKEIISALKKNAHQKDYTLPDGIEDLNSKLKNIYKTSNYSPDKILVGCGLKELIFITLLAFKGKVIIINPSWVSYIEQTKILNKKILEINTKIENNYKLLDFELDNALKQINKKEDKLLIFNNPVNPTGVNYSKEDLIPLSKVLKKHNVAIFADEIYNDLVYTNNFYSISELIPNQTIIGNSLSKNFACGGYRLGWLIFPKNLSKLSNAIYSYASSIYSCAPLPQQYAAVKALSYQREIKQYTKKMRDTFSSLGKECFLKLSNCGIPCSKPEAGWYIFINFEKYKSNLKNHGILSSSDLVEYLLKQYGIVVIPGSSFGCKDISFRFSFIDIEISKLSSTIEVWGYRVLRAMEILCDLVKIKLK